MDLTAVEGESGLLNPGRLRLLKVKFFKGKRTS